MNAGIRWTGTAALAAIALAACDRQSPVGPEGDALGFDAAARTAETTIGAPGQLFFFNDAGLTRSYPRSPCRGATPHRDFDFWLGEWEVFGPAGGVAGTNLIRPLLDGCLVEENWTGAGGGQGRSMNAYDAATGTWSQYWMDQFGLHLRLEGGLVDGKMVLQGPRNFSGGTLIDRITWTDQANGDVNQFWDISIDGGETFPFVVFNGTYVSTPGVVAAPPLQVSFCPNADYRQLDFLVGDWNVHKSSGQAVGEASVKIDMQGCMLEADFATHAGYVSQSFFGWDIRTGDWYRNYMDAEGVRLKMSGGLVGDAMVLEAVRPGASGDLGVRVSISPDGPDRVIEQWSTRKGGGFWEDGATVVLERA